jgi:hypothetical protein
VQAQRDLLLKEKQNSEVKQNSVVKQNLAKDLNWTKGSTTGGLFSS